MTLFYAYDGGAGCAAGFQACVNGYYAGCENAHTPQLEFCDGRDTDCDGVPDPATCPCNTGFSCYQGVPRTAGVGACVPGTWNCSLPVGQQCVGQVLPAAVETCNGLDDDCNGLVDDNNPQTSPCGPGVCASARKQCVGGTEVACDYGANPPPSHAASEICGDGLDNECDGFVDDGCVCSVGAMVACWTGSSSACPTDGGSCLGVCRRGNQTCANLSDGGTGWGSCSGQTPASAESCSDSLDNDCDGTQDCMDSDCNGRSCGANGRICTGGSCQCTVPDGGTTQGAETICNDGFDNDCDGLVDCAESACNTAACGTNGRVCNSGACTCSGNGGTVQATESACTDTFDNECDGTTDCGDTDCAGNAACMATTENCKDGIDNDLDTKIDCADTDCFHKVCGATSNLVCCGTTCTDLTQQGNCGQCGLSCLSGSTCIAVGSSSHMSGTCTCPTGMNSQCPTPAGYNAQTCVSNQCTCNGNDDRCGNAGTGQGSRCIDVTIDYCHYQ